MLTILEEQYEDYTKNYLLSINLVHTVLGRLSGRSHA